MHELRVDADLNDADDAASPPGSRLPQPLLPRLHPGRAGAAAVATATPEPSTRASAGAATGSSSPGSKWVGTSTARPRLLSLQQKLHVARLLEDNKALGVRRLESWRLSKSLEEFGWVFGTLCVNVPSAHIEEGLAAWDGADCARFVTNLGLPQYADTFAFNLRGPSLPGLRITQLAQLGVASFAHQKRIMQATRDLLEAFIRKERAAKAARAWSGLLSGEAGADEPDDSSDEGALDVSDGAWGAAKAPPARPGQRHAPHATPARGAMPHGEKRRRGGLGGGGGSGGLGMHAAASATSAVKLPIHVHLPALASTQKFEASRTRQHAGRARMPYVPKPSIVPPMQPAMATANGPAIQHGGQQQHRYHHHQHHGGDGHWESSGAAAEHTQWDELARSYGLHLIPDHGGVLLHNLQTSRQRPQRADLMQDDNSLRSPREASIPWTEQDPSTRMIAADLTESPSLPLLSPGRVGTRNWVTFLHGGTM